MTALAWFNTITASIILIRAISQGPGRHEAWVHFVCLLMFIAYLAQSVTILIN